MKLGAGDAGSQGEGSTCAVHCSSGLPCATSSHEDPQRHPPSIAPNRRHRNPTATAPPHPKWSITADAHHACGGATRPGAPSGAAKCATVPAAGRGSWRIWCTAGACAAPWYASRLAAARPPARRDCHASTDLRSSAVLCARVYKHAADSTIRRGAPARRDAAGDA